MYGQYSRAVSNHEWVIVARVRYQLWQEGWNFPFIKYTKDCESRLKNCLDIVKRTCSFNRYLRVCTILASIFYQIRKKYLQDVCMSRQSCIFGNPQFTVNLERDSKSQTLRVSVQGVESLWGDCRFIPADWGSYWEICAICSF